ncbi:MAG: hypothetical protein KDC54_22655, partial [Lewinella sp.]|nr:hypothetical protein [Lewinella sp.]
GGDCLMRLRPHAYFDPVTRVAVLDVFNIWGGCRAGGHEAIQLRMGRPAGAFRVLVQEIQVDSEEEYEGFVAPE